MDPKYQINDTRLLNDFKDCTFCGFKKSDVFNTLFKNIDKNMIENACNWITECIVSGYSLVIWDKLLIYAFKTIHINNPFLPQYLLNKTQILYNQFKRLNIKDKDIVLILRNSQMIRNLFFDVIVTLCSSSKTKKYDKYPKIKEEDFDFNNLRTRLTATMNVLPNHIIHFNDPEELKIIINEFYFNLKNPLIGYDKCIYWVLWLIKWDDLHKKKKNPWQVGPRDVPLKDNLKCDVIWVIWETIFEEIKYRIQNREKNIKSSEKQIKCLYELFLHNYSAGKRNSRLPYVFLSIAFLTLKINYDIPLRNNFQAFIQSQANVNKMFEIKKLNEKKSDIFIKQAEEDKKLKKLKKNNNDLMNAKISVFNEINF